MAADNEKDKNRKSKLINTGAKSRLITPFVMLSGTAVIAIYTYMQGYALNDWLVIVLGTLVLFLIIGSVLEKLVAGFVRTTLEREEEEAAAARAAEEENGEAPSDAEGGAEGAEPASQGSGAGT